MKIELNLLNKKLLIMAGFCAILDGLMIGIEEYSDLRVEGILKPLNNYTVHWSSDHSHLARIPETLYNNLKSLNDFLEIHLKHIVPKTIKGSFFSTKVSPNHSRIHLSEDFQEKPHFNDLSLNFYNIDDEINVEPTNKEQLENISIIEKKIMEDETEEFFLFSQDRATPVLVNLDEIVEEVQERRSKTPSKMYEIQNSPEKIGKFFDFRRVSLNGRVFMKSTDAIRFKPKKPKPFKPKPPVTSPGFMRKMRKTKSSKDFANMELLTAEEFKRIGMNEVYQSLEQYAEKNHRPSRDDWMD